MKWHRISSRQEAKWYFPLVDRSGAESCISLNDVILLLIHILVLIDLTTMKVRYPLRCP